MTQARRWGLVLGLVVGAGCRGDASPAAGGEAAPPPAANARALLDEARRELANHERTPLREGMKIDDEGLRQAMVRLRAQHGAQVAGAYAAEIEALPAGELPAAPRFQEVAAFTISAEPAAREVEALNWLFDADVQQTVSRVLGTYVTLMMVRDLGMASVEVGIWMAFLRAAKPELRRCGGDGNTQWMLCLDYGRDVFVFEVEREGPAWIVTRLRWMQVPAD